METKNKRLYRIRIMSDKTWQPEIVTGVNENLRERILARKLQKHLKGDFEVLTAQCVLGKFTRDVLQQIDFWELQNFNFRMVDTIDYDEILQSKNGLK